VCEPRCYTLEISACSATAALCLHTTSAVRRTSELWLLRRDDGAVATQRGLQQSRRGVDSDYGLSCGEHALIGDKSTGIASLLAMRLTPHDTVQKEAVQLLSHLLEAASGEGSAAAAAATATAEAAAEVSAAAAKAASAGASLVHFFLTR
jgi:hypothetical protein